MNRACFDEGKPCNVNETKRTKGRKETCKHRMFLKKKSENVDYVFNLKTFFNDSFLALCSILTELK